MLCSHRIHMDVFRLQPCIGGSTYKISRRTPPLRDPILSFSHTFSPKSAHIGGPRPSPDTGPRPHCDKSWVRRCPVAFPQNIVCACNFCNYQMPNAPMFKVQLILDLTKWQLTKISKPTFCNMGPFLKNHGPTEPTFDITVLIRKQRLLMVLFT